ncbi:AraC family transcriptional regulator [uncultured Desulfobacter sp.]|uniref:helix-turn-helix transcriptional regulator n=1 Tax=uncultured Desulfobacter sp. TaxID=240139 RepID=UPI002AA94E65|nr:AraC family transcriptional regulator [uncultured Desulfobacter sp.]
MQTIQIGTLTLTATPNQFKTDLPPSIGQGKTDILTFNSGLQLMTIHRHPKHPVLFQGFLKEPFVGFGFCLDGRFDYRPVCFDHPITISAGQSGFFSFPKSVEVFEKADDQRMLRIYLMLNGDRLFKLAQGDEDRFYPVLKSLDAKSHSRFLNIITPVMKVVLYQIIHCPYIGMTRQIFLEGKAMELLAHKMEQLCPGSGRQDYAMKPSDVERVHHAAHLLVRDLNNPPDIMTLTNLVGLNRDKLHQCFRKVFGFSPFEFLRDQRLKTAMLLLQDGELNVTQAALMVGYSNISHFAKAFKSKFGITPGQLRKASPSSFSDRKIIYDNIKSNSAISPKIL